MMYWDIMNGRGFLPSTDPLVSLFLGYKWITVAYYLENLHYCLPRYISQDIADDQIGWVMRNMDMAGAVIEADEPNMYRLLHLARVFESVSPGACSEVLAVLYEKAGYVPDVYYDKCLSNWRRTRSQMLVHYENIQQLTDIGREEWVKMHVDMEFRSVDAIRGIATAFKSTAPEKMLRLVLQSVKSMNCVVDHVRESGGLQDDGTAGRCLSLRLFGVVLGLGEMDIAGLCEEHAKIFRRADKVGHMVEESCRDNALVSLWDECRSTWRELNDKYLSVVP